MVAISPVGALAGGAGVAADATAQDLDAGMACCESPSYELR